MKGVKMLIFTDASFSDNPKMSGLGSVIITDSEEISVGAYSKKCEDNNIAEVAAIAMALKHCETTKLFQRCEDKTVTFCTDSLYALRKVTEEREPKTDFEEKLLNYIQKSIKSANKKINFLHIKAHLDSDNKMNHYNKMADKIAGEYRMLGVELTNDKPKKKEKFFYTATDEKKISSKKKNRGR